MKNALEKWIENFGETPEHLVMNVLHEYGIVSDNCIHAKDVADVDCTKAIEFLEGKSVSIK